MAPGCLCRVGRCHRPLWPHRSLKGSGSLCREPRGTSWAGLVGAHTVAFLPCVSVTKQPHVWVGAPTPRDPACHSAPAQMDEWVSQAPCQGGSLGPAGRLVAACPTQRHRRAQNSLEQVCSRDKKAPFGPGGQKGSSLPPGASMAPWTQCLVSGRNVGGRILAPESAAWSPKP